MLIIEIAIGVFLGGVVLWIFVASRAKKKQAEQAKFMVDAADRYVAQRFKSIEDKHQSEIRAKLIAILDDPDSDPIGAIAAEAQSNLTSENFNHFKAQVATEAQDDLKDILLAASKIGTYEGLKRHIDYSIDSACKSLGNNSVILLMNELGSFNDADLPALTQGHPRKQFNLGNACRLGTADGIAQDYDKAVRLLRQSADQGYVHAQSLLGQMYFDGEGVAQDFTVALKWYLQAAAQKEAYAQNALGLMYSNGLGVKQDFEEALKWHSLSASQGCEVANTNIGVMYSRGEGVEKDVVHACTLFILAAAKGDATALSNLLIVNGEMSPEKTAKAEMAALENDKSVLNFIMQLSNRKISDVLTFYYDAALLADYFADNYLKPFTTDRKWMGCPNASEIKQFAINELEINRCWQECLILAAMGVTVTVLKNKSADFAAAFSLRLADNLAALLGRNEIAGARGEVQAVIDNYIDDLESSRMVAFACTYTERVFSGNANESSIFAAEFWNRAFTVAMATMGASKEFIERCIETEILREMCGKPAAQE